MQPPMAPLAHALDALMEIVEHAIASGDWKVDGACDPDMALTIARCALAKAGYVRPKVQQEGW